MDMKYNKPELIVVGSAASAVRGEKNDITRMTATRSTQSEAHQCL